MLALLPASTKGGSTGPASDRRSQEGARSSVIEGLEQREGGWRQGGLMPPAPGLPGGPAFADLGSSSQRQLPRPALQHYQVRILDCGDQVTAKGQMCEGNSDVRDLGGEPEVTGVRWQVAGPAWPSIPGPMVAGSSFPHLSGVLVIKEGPLHRACCSDK